MSEQQVDHKEDSDPDDDEIKPLKPSLQVTKDPDQVSRLKPPQRRSLVQSDKANFARPASIRKRVRLEVPHQEKEKFVPPMEKTDIWDFFLGIGSMTLEVVFYLLCFLALSYLIPFSNSNMYEGPFMVRKVPK
eukprot:c970_g1_i2.p1 GENE.c970_g1_i2~~c970_g1_i2.p1  ORF type:complete len:143 (+),score=13.93 c970_g1_i2:31-429(+)